MFKTPDECERKEFINSNPRYKGFCQTYFTAGDEEQFEESRDRLQLLTPSTVPNHLYPDIWDGYKDISHQQILTTFRYIFNKFKKGPESGPSGGIVGPEKSQNSSRDVERCELSVPKTEITPPTEMMSDPPAPAPAPKSKGLFKK